MSIFSDLLSVLQAYVSSMQQLWYSWYTIRSHSAQTDSRRSSVASLVHRHPDGAAATRRGQKDKQVSEHHIVKRRGFNINAIHSTCLWTLFFWGAVSHELSKRSVQDSGWPWFRKVPWIQVLLEKALLGHRNAMPGLLQKRRYQDWYVKRTLD